MDQLIPVFERTIGEETIQAVDARELHSYLEVGKTFGAWITSRIKTYGFSEHVDFEVFSNSGKNPAGGRPIKEYVLTLDMAKELSMVERTPRGKQARRYFIECERIALASAISQAAQLPAPETTKQIGQVRGALLHYIKHTAIPELLKPWDELRAYVEDRFKAMYERDAKYIRGVEALARDAAAAREDARAVRAMVDGLVKSNAELRKAAEPVLSGRALIRDEWADLADVYVMAGVETPIGRRNMLSTRIRNSLDSFCRMGRQTDMTAIEVRGARLNLWRVTAVRDWLNASGARIIGDHVAQNRRAA